MTCGIPDRGAEGRTAGRLWSVAAVMLLLSPVAVMPALADDDVQLGPVVLMGDSAHYLEVGVGAFDVLDEEAETAGAAKLELRLGDKLAFIGPGIGLLATLDGSVLGYGGLYLDVALGPVVLTPMLAVAGYAGGDGKDLGGVLQFRSSLGVAYAFDGGVRLGAQIAHTSNAGLDEPNPGEEEIFVTLAWPF